MPAQETSVLFSAVVVVLLLCLNGFSTVLIMDGKMADKEKQQTKKNVSVLPHDARARREQLSKAQEMWAQRSLQKSDDVINSEDK